MRTSRPSDCLRRRKLYKEGKKVNKKSSFELTPKLKKILKKDEEAEGLAKVCLVKWERVSSKSINEKRVNSK